MKEAALFLRNLLELICAGVTRKVTLLPAPTPQPLPLPTPPDHRVPGPRKGRTVWVGGSRL